MFKKDKIAKMENVAEQNANEESFTQGKKEKKQRVKGRRKNSGKKAIISFIVAVILFLVLLVIQTGVMSDYEKTTVVVTKRVINKNEDITKGNVNDYFGLEEVNVTNTPDGYISSIDNLIGKRTDRAFVLNEMVTSSSVKEQNEAIDAIATPVDASFKVDSASQVVGGTLRKGDIINIQTIKVENGEIKVTGSMLKVYVSDVFNSSGEKLDSSSAGVALTVNIIIDEKDMTEFNTLVSSGTIRVVRLSDEDISAGVIINNSEAAQDANTNDAPNNVSSEADKMEDEVEANTTEATLQNDEEQNISGVMSEEAQETKTAEE